MSLAQYYASHLRPVRSILFIVGLAVGLSAPATFGMFLRPTALPIVRIVKTIRETIRKQPKNAEAHYQLGRAYYLSFVHRSDSIPVSGDEDEWQVAADHLVGDWTWFEREQESARRTRAEMKIASLDTLADDQRQNYYERKYEIEQQLEAKGWQAKQLTIADALKHATLAMQCFRRASELQPDNALFHLGLASLSEQVLSFVQDNPRAMIPDELRKVTGQTTCNAYQTAYKLAIDSDLQRPFIPVEGISGMVAYEAGEGFVRLCSRVDTEEAKTVSQGLAKLKKIPMGPVTPLVLQLESTAHASKLLASHDVVFDMLGNGTASRWTWVRPDVGLLVWDPQHRGEITSGADLFGNFAFQMLWSDGFQPLRIFDDNHDEVLDCHELAAIRVWFDRNGDARSTPQEFVDLADLNVEAIRLESTRWVDGVLTMPSAVQLRDGGTLPLWDWVAQPIQAAEPAGADSL